MDLLAIQQELGISVGDAPMQSAPRFRRGCPSEAEETRMRTEAERPTRMPTSRTRVPREKTRTSDPVVRAVVRPSENDHRSRFRRMRLSLSNGRGAG